MKKLFGLIAVASVLLVACSKDMKVAKQLEGTWTLSEVTTDGVATPDSVLEGQTYTFDKCKSGDNKDGNCSGSYTYEDESKGTQTESFSWGISDKGETFSMTISFLGISETTTSTIDEYSSSKFVTTHTDTDGEVTVTTMTK